MTLYRKYEDTIVNLAEVQSIKPNGLAIEFTFTNGKVINVFTHQYDFIINSPGRTTIAMQEQYEECIEKWQKITITAIYETLKMRG